jgi:ureidoglycolate hydrolase
VTAVPRVRGVTAQPLTAEAFRDYGVYVAEPARAADWGASGSRIEGVREGRVGHGRPVAQLWNLGDLSFGAETPYVGFVRYFHQGFQVAELERHPHETQTWVALTGTSIVVVAGATPGGLPAAESVAAFLVEPGDLLAIGEGVWMCHFFPIGPEATYAVLTARREPEQDRDLVNLARTEGVVIEIRLADPPASPPLPPAEPPAGDLAGQLAASVREAARRLPQDTQPGTVYRLAEPPAPA